jgi:hypothetical protein
MSANPNRDSGKTDQGNRPPKKSSIIRVFRTLKRQYHHAKRYGKKGETEHQRNEKMMARWTRRLGILTIVLAFIAGITACILYVTDQTLKDTLKAGITEQRAFIFRKEYALIPRTEGDKITGWRVMPVLENSGSVPTTSFYIYTDTFEMPFEFDKGDIRCDVPFAQVYKTIENGIPRLLGPHQISRDEAEIRTYSVEEIQRPPKLRFFVYGIMKYTDEFSPKPRQTRFCNAFIFDGDPTRYGLSYGQAPTRTGNCIDDECEKQDRKSNTPN